LINDEWWNWKRADWNDRNNGNGRNQTCGTPSLSVSSRTRDQTRPDYCYCFPIFFLFSILIHIPIHVPIRTPIHTHVYIPIYIPIHTHVYALFMSLSIPMFYHPLYNHSKPQKHFPEYDTHFPLRPFQTIPGSFQNPLPALETKSDAFSSRIRSLRFQF